MTKFFLVGAVLAGLLGSGCAVDVGGFGAEAIEGLECGRLRAGYLAPQAEGCWVSILKHGCTVTLPSDPCADALEWYPGGVAFEVWCGADVEMPEGGAALRSVDCADVQ